MTTNYLKQITLAAIGTGCIALGVATEAQAAALSGTFEVTGFLFDGETTAIDFPGIVYGGTGDFATMPGAIGTVSGDSFSDIANDGPIENFFVFTETDGLSFTLTSAEEVDNDMGIAFTLMGTIEDGEGHTTHLTGSLTGQHTVLSSWSATLETKRVPEPSTMIGLLGVTALGVVSLRKAKLG
ncbi:MAG: PEP-CTERM sorting domain-containing protein [Cyanobacteriota bacterium]|nr:PEP-CTERM sorting domain-containing protein [Cyanobacteriota bacterium]